MYIGGSYFPGSGPFTPFTLNGSHCVLNGYYPALFGNYFGLVGTGTVNTTSALSSGTYAILVVAYAPYAPSTVTLAITFPAATYATTSFFSMSMILTTSGMTTLTTSTILEVPFIQTYGYLIVAAVIAVLLVGLLLFTRRMRQLK